MNKGVRRVVLVALAAGGVTRAADAGAAELTPSGMPLKAPVAANALPPSDWTGFYVGAHVGYAAGNSNWMGSGATPLAGTLNFFESFDAFKGTGSYLGGLQAGYNHMLPSRLLLGIEADLSFPNTISANRAFTGPAFGVASYGETVETFGTLRARIGKVIGSGPFDKSLIYATGGFAWSYDRFVRTQLVGTPLGGLAGPGTVETIPKMRTGFAAGAGIEVPVLPQWTAKLEYLFTGFGARDVVFPAGAQRVDGDLNLHTLRLGLNYRYDANAEPFALPSAPETDTWAFHAQSTYVSQYAFPFRSPYLGINSLAPNHGRETWDLSFYAGMRLWAGAELWINPEMDQGFGLSNTHGVAGYVSGEAYKVGSSFPYARVPRYFIRQTIGLGGDSEKVEADVTQFAGQQQANRLVFTVGKFSVSDIFDTNKYATNPRKDFFNWSAINSSTFDYAADAWGYTYGASAEWYQGPWTLRAGAFDLSIAPNAAELDPSFAQFQSIIEVEHRYELGGQPGKVTATAFLNRGRMGKFADALALATQTGQPADITAVRQYRSRYGVSANAEQQIMADVGVFARAGVARGDVEPYEFADIDRTMAAGLSLGGKLWARADDTLGIAGIVNGISSVHEAYLNAGGAGILVGDGRLPHPGNEQIVEINYSFPLFSWRATLDYQYVVNPAYNRDRGPVSVVGTRMRAQF